MLALHLRSTFVLLFTWNFRVAYMTSRQSLIGNSCIVHYLWAMFQKELLNQTCERVLWLQIDWRLMWCTMYWGEQWESVDGRNRAFRQLKERMVLHQLNFCSHHGILSPLAPFAQFFSTVFFWRILRVETLHTWQS